MKGLKKEKRKTMVIQIGLQTPTRKPITTPPTLSRFGVELQLRLGPEKNEKVFELGIVFFERKMILY